jgi:hypothetical protein
MVSSILPNPQLASTCPALSKENNQTAAELAQFELYLAVRGRQPVITSPTPAGLFERITGSPGPRTAAPMIPAPAVRDWREPANR